MCKGTTEDNISVNGNRDVNAPALCTSEKKSEPEQKSKEKAGNKREQLKSTSADKMKSFTEKLFELQ